MLSKLFKYIPHKPSLLEIISKNQITQSELMRKSKYSGGKIYSCVKAMKTMKLIENGNGLRITEIGKLFLTLSNSHNKEEFRRTIKMASLNAPMFEKLYQNNKETTDPIKLFELFEKEISPRYENVDPKFLGAIVRRYLQGIYNIKLPVGFKFHPEKKRNLPEDRKITYFLKNKGNHEIIENLKNLKKSLDLSDKDFHNLINSLPEKKREEVLSQIFSKVFK